MLDLMRELFEFTEINAVAAVALTALLVVGIALRAVLALIQKLE